MKTDRQLNLSRLANPARAALMTLGLLAVSVPAQSAFAQDVEGEYRPNGTGRVVRPSPHFGLSLLRTFYFRFLNGDHHIAAIIVDPDQPLLGQTTLMFKDDDGNDPYFFLTQHAAVDPTGIILDAFGDEICRGICTFPINRPAGDFVFVLRGFSIRWIGPDHHLQHIGVSEQNGNLMVAFHDADSRGNNDNFLVSVQFAWVPRSRFASLGTAEASSVPGGAQRQPIPVGTAVIRGFDVAFTSADHHLEEIGFVQRGGGSLDAFFNDNDNNDRFNWAVDWGVLN